MPNDEAAMKLDGNEIWEWLFGEMEGSVPEELTDDLLNRLAEHINTHLLRAETANTLERSDLVKRLNDSAIMFDTVSPAGNVSIMGALLREAALALSSPGRVDGWQDIATAPKDGSWILGSVPTHGDPAIRPLWMLFWSERDNGWSQGSWLFEPAHWQPLPAPPLPR